MNTQDIIGNFNILVEKIIKSVENEVYKNIDSILVIDKKIFKVEPLNKLILEDDINGRRISSIVVPSRDYRKFMEDRQIELTDWEKAVLVYNNPIASYDHKMCYHEHVSPTRKGKCVYD